MALETFGVVAFGIPFTTFPTNKVPDTPDSLASGQPSPSESKSKLFGIPSSSTSLIHSGCISIIASDIKIPPGPNTALTPNILY